MNIRVDADTCTACELCYDRLPLVFSDRGDGIPIVVIKDWSKIEDLKRDIEAVAEDCPSGSIVLWTG
ncbi:MAG: ferredoxin [Acidobacteria bacterium]|jgi:ferredoxin|nr:MAG: ferredoxin [Acidobacteriota bacterium]